LNKIFYQQHSQLFSTSGGRSSKASAISLSIKAIKAGGH
tara:strand:+ start:3075 stop:3191 length:117 start_codon:yes stop_codon:yes gene_type:complete